MIKISVLDANWKITNLELQPHLAGGQWVNACYMLLKMLKKPKFKCYGVSCRIVNTIVILHVPQTACERVDKCYQAIYLINVFTTTSTDVFHLITVHFWIYIYMYIYINAISVDYVHEENCKSKLIYIIWFPTKPMHINPEFPFVM